MSGQGDLKRGHDVCLGERRVFKGEIGLQWCCNAERVHLVNHFDVHGNLILLISRGNTLQAQVQWSSHPCHKGLRGLDRQEIIQDLARGAGGLYANVLVFLKSFRYSWMYSGDALCNAGLTARSFALRMVLHPKRLYVKEQDSQPTFQRAANVTLTAALWAYK